MNGMVLLAQNEPTGLRRPRGTLHSASREEVGHWREMRGPHELLLFLRKVSAEKLRATRKHPGVPVNDFNAREDIRRIFVELVLNSLSLGWRHCSDIDETSDAIIDS